MKIIGALAFPVVLMSSLASGKEKIELSEIETCFIDQYIVQTLSDLSFKDKNFDSNDGLIDLSISIPAEVVKSFIPGYITDTNFGASTIKENLSLHFYELFERVTVKGKYSKYSKLPELYKIPVKDSVMSWKLAEKTDQGFLVTANCSVGYEYVHECLFSMNGNGYSLAYDLRQDNFDQKNEIDGLIKNQLYLCSNKLGLNVSN